MGDRGLEPLTSCVSSRWEMGKGPPIPFVQCRAQHDPCGHPAKGTGSSVSRLLNRYCGAAVPLSSYEVSSPSVGPGPPSSCFFSWLRFHGRNNSMSPGTLPPATAQCSKYQVSHFRALSPHSANVAKIENADAANWPLQSDPEP